jgi:bifunctional non-homologous end joining protein LigD
MSGETRRFGPYTVELERLDKVLYPDAGITKREVVDYYQAVADPLLAHLEDRPLTLRRFPDGIAEEGFYQKQAPDYIPGWIARVEVPLAEGGSQEQITAGNAATLAYLAGQAALELHPWLSRSPELDSPDQIVFDLDPGEDRDFGDVRTAALRLRELLVSLEMKPRVMVTGSSGAHVRVPLRAGPGFDEVRAFARRVVEHLAARHPDDLTVESRKKDRKGRLYLDVARNARGQTAVAPYSLRALPGAPVALPLEWDEFRNTRDARAHTLASVPRRLEERGDPWKGVGREARSLDRALEAARGVLEG